MTPTDFAAYPTGNRCTPDAGAERRHPPRGRYGPARGGHHGEKDGVVAIPTEIAPDVLTTESGTKYDIFNFGTG